MVQLRFWRRRGITDQAISPDAPFCVIGDVHGCADLLDRLITRLDTSFPTDPIVVAGDFIDRGPNSAKVLTILSAHPRVQCLLGNHEDMLLNFLGGQTDDVRAWLRAGGVKRCRVSD